jgi:autotransporter-associated beta strand protein
MNLVVQDGTFFLGQSTTTFTNLTITGGTLKMDPAFQVATAGTWQGTFGNEVFMNGGTWDLNGTGTNGVNNRIKRVSGSGGLITNSNASEALLVLAARDNSAPSWAGSIQDGVGPVAVTINNSGSGGFGTTMTFSGNNTLSNSTGSKLDLGNFNNTVGSLTGGANSQVLLGSGTLTTGAKGDASTAFEGVISGTGGLVKVGTGTFSLSGTNLYTGDTTVSAGVLAVDGDAIANATKLVVSGGKVEATGTEVVDTLYFDATQQASGTWGATGSGATHIDDVHFSGTAGVVQVVNGPAGGYGTWATTNAGGQTADEDFDLDGIDNGIEFFMGETGSTVTANPSVVVSGSDRTVTWPKSAGFGGTYEVQTSPDLVSWSPASVVDNGTSVVYTFPAPSGKLFVRLVVTPN